jgi:hypothetical protein
MRRMRGCAWTAAAALWTGASAAWGVEPGPDTVPINVIAVQTFDADDQAEALTRALRNAVRALPGWALSGGDYSLEVLTLSLKCREPPDEDCQSRIGGQIKSDRYIWGTLQKTGAYVQGSLQLWVRGKGTVKVPIRYASNLTEANNNGLGKVATDAVNQLTLGPPKGEVHVTAGNVPGQVFVDGQPIGALRAGEGRFTVPIGRHQITVKAPGHVDGAAQVTVKWDAPPATVAVTLTPIKETKERENEDKTPINWRRLGGFGAMGLGVVFVAVGLGSSLRVNSIAREHNQENQEMYKYRQYKTQRTPDVCKTAPEDARNMQLTADIRSLAVATQKACSDARTPYALQFVFYPLAAVSVAAGAYLVGTAGAPRPKPAAGLTVDPQFGPAGGKLNIAYTW